MSRRRRETKFAAVPVRPVRPREAVPSRSMLLLASSPLVLGLVAAMAGTSPAHAQAVNLGGANNIVADGRTKTSITVEGTRTSITTGTVSGNTGFNSFSDFQQAAGTQVDLYVPDNAGNLLNIVHNGPVVIDGILNGYKDGKIGGNIYFSDSHGFVVGSNGVVNVGSLTVNTPTSEFLDTVVAPDGTVNDGAAQQLMQGAIPISPDGMIAIAGTINAKGGITLQGRDVDVTGGKISINDTDNHVTLFKSTVNTGGVSEGGMMVSQGGQIRIIATDKARIGGTLKASAPKTGGKGGAISIKGNDVVIDGAARLSANGEVEGGGGTVEAVAVDSLLVEDGALFSARGAGSGMGGFVDLSGKLAQIGAVHVDLGSDTGKAGKLLIDPVNLSIDGTNSIVTNGTVTLQADNSITVSSGGSIDTTSAPAGAGTITLESRLITVANGASITASAGSDVILTATVDGNTFSGDADAAIVIGSGSGAAPIISGRNVILTATATANTPSLLLALATAHADISINAGTITATDQFKANASASTDATVDFLPVAIVVTDVRSSVQVGGTAQISADSAELTAESTVSSVLQTMSIAPPSTVVDAAATVSTVDSTATVSVDGDASLNITGAANLAASNDITTTAIAEPAIAKLGASVSVSIIDANTSATIGGNASVSSGSLALDASTTTAATVTAAASESGGGAPQQNSEAKAFLDDPKYSAGTSTSEGGISVVGGFAITDLTSTTLAKIDSTNAVTATDDLSVTSSTSNSADATADGSAVDSTTGVGVAVAFNLAHVSNDALIESAVQAGSLELSAKMVDPDGVNHFAATATSGAGATNVGIAGSLATNVVDTESVARIGPSGSVTIDNGGEVNIESADVTEASASATPSAPVTGGKVGIGASIAINIIANRSTAELADSAGLSGAGDVTLAAEGEFTAEAEAEAGAAGGIAITPALGLNLVSNSTTARLGIGSTFLAHSLDVSAVQQSETTTTAAGDAAGSKAAVGAALALAIINDNVSATTNRALDIGGDVTFTAMGASLSELEAHASASGGEASEDDGSAPADGNVDSKVDDQFSSAETKQSDAGVGDQSQRDKSSADANDKEGHSASTSEGKVSVAAAVGVNVQTASVSATIPDNVTVNAGGALTLSTAANTDGKVTADGSAVGEDGAATSQVGIGAAVAVNKVTTSNVARLGKAAHALDGLTVEALKADIAKKLADPLSSDTRADEFSTSATSGAGGTKVGIAGSLALNLIDSESSATIAGGAHLTMGGTGAITLTADARGGVEATAAPVDGGATGGKVGIGVSAAINILANRATAAIEDGVVVSGAGDVALSASGNFTAKAEAEAGSAGGISLTPALGLSLINNTTTAQLGTGTTFEARSLDVAAVQQSSTTTKASADAAGSKAAIGASLALALVNDEVRATTSRNLDIDDRVGFTAMGASFSILEAKASASGGEAAKDDGSNQAGDKDVDGKVDDQLGSAETKQTKSGVGDTTQQGKTKSAVDDKDGRSASTSEGKVTVAAAVGVNVQTSSVSATIPDTVTVNAGGTLTLSTAANTDGKVTADGSAVGKDGAQTAQVGIGAAVAVNKISATNVAQLGAANHTLGGLEIEALKTDVAKRLADPHSADTRADVFLATATSGAGGSKVGIAGSVALNLIDTESSARIAGGSHVTLTNGGAVSLAADGEGGATATAAPTGGGATGGKVGIGVSAAINIIANRSIAEIANGATLVGLNTAANPATAAAIGDLSLSASGDFETTADATAGSAGGISVTPALGLNMVSNSTTARLGTDSSGSPIWAHSVNISATQEAATTTKASAEANGGTAAIGVSLALALVDDEVLATTDRSITSVGAVTFTAMGKSEGELEAKAGASGAKAADDNGNATAGDKDVDTKVNDQLTTGKTKQTDAGVGDSAQQGKTTTTVTDDNSKKQRSAKTSEGKVAVAAAVAVNVQDSTVTAVVPNAVVINAGGKLTITSGNTTGAKASADGTASKAEVGIGVAVAVNVVDKTTLASLGTSSHTVNGLDITARQYGNPATPVVDDYETTATSGAGGSKVGIAGSLALNLINATTTAHTLGNVNAGAGASSITADQRITAKATAAPSGNGANGGKVGIGASVALNLLTDTTTAELPDGVTFSNGGGLTVSANSVLDTTTEAEAGAGGGIAVDAVVALAILDQTTIARIGTGVAINTAGDVEISASSSGENEASAKGDTKAAKVGVGAAAAVILGGGTKTGDLKNTSVTSAELARNVTAASLTISAESDRSYTADATATAGGGKESTETASGGQSTSGDTLQKTENSQQGTQAPPQGGSSKISVAAAVGVAAAQDVVSATLDAVTVHVTGDLKVDATNSTGMATIGSGAATNPQSKVGVGIGVALGIINNTTTATIADGAVIANSGSVEVKTDTKENTTGDFAEKLTANAIAGASSSKVSVAGALAVGISTSSSTASIGDNVQVSSTGAVNVLADNTSKLSAKSVAGATSSGSIGIGASVATVVANHSLTANIGADDTVTATDVSVQALDRKFAGLPSIPTFTLDFSKPDKLLDQVKDQAKDAAQHNGLLGNANYYAEAMGGAAAGSNAIEGSFAVMVFSDTVNASIGKSMAATPITTKTTIDASGGVRIEAGNDLVAKALAGGIALGSSNGVGISSSVIVSSGTTTALLAQNAEITHSTSFSDKAHATQDINAFGISAAGGGNNGVAGVATVITSTNSVQALLALNTSVTSSGNVTVGASNGFDTFSLAGGAAGGGSNGIGAAASVVTVDNVTRAALAKGSGSADAVTIAAPGAVTISADASETGKTFTAAGAAAGSNAVGAGAAVYVLGTTTEALVGAYATIGTSTTIHPSSVSLEASDDTELTTVAGAIAGGGTVGAGAGAAVGVVIKTTTASIADNATVYAGNVSVGATSSEQALTTAVGVGIGGTAGLAGALSVYAVSDTTTAEIGDASVWADRNVAVLSSDDVAIDFISGAAGFSGTAAVGAAASVAVVTTHTHALIDDGASVTALGNGNPTTDAVSYVSGYTPALGGASGDYAAPTPGDYAYSTTGADGEVLTADEARRQGLRLLALTRSATPITSKAHGVVVNASGDTSVRSLAIGAGISGTVGISISANVPVITTDILASIGDNTSINVDNAGSPNAQQSVTVAAAGDLYRTGLAGSVGGGTVGIGGGLETAIISPTVTASIGKNSEVNAKRDVAVTASSHQDLTGAAAAAGVGVAVGVSGGVTVFSLDSHTTAAIESNATVTADGNVVVAAEDITRTGMVVGSLAVGATGAGVGGSVGLSLISKDTEASIADNASVKALGQGGTLTAYSGADFSSTQSAQGILVSANSNESVFTLSIAGAGGLFAGVAGAVSIQLLYITTTASIGDATINGDNTGANAGQDVVVVARDSTSVAAIDGGLALGAGAVAGAVDVGVLRNTTAASIGDGATVNAQDRVEVAGLQNSDVDSTVVSAAGGLVGIAAGVSVYSIGDGIDPTSKGNSELTVGGQSTGGYAQGQLGDDSINRLLASSDDTRVKGVGTQVTSARAGVSVADINTQFTIPAGTSASVGNATITTGASGALTVASVDTLGTDAVTGAVGVGLGGLGAGIGIVTVDTTNTAQLTGTSTVTSGSVAVTATTTHTLQSGSLAAAFGAIAAEASLALLTDNAVTSASISGTTLLSQTSVIVTASDQRTATTSADGASFGAGAVGVSVAAVNLGGSVSASLGKVGNQGVQFGTSASRVGSVDVHASSQNSSTATAEAASGGIGLAAQGSDAEANTTTEVTASADSATVYATGDFGLAASSAGRASADASGLALAGILAAGGSFAHANVAEQVATHVYGSSLIDAGSITLSAAVTPNTTTPAVSASASGSSGAMVGLTATEAKAVNISGAGTLVEHSALAATGTIALTSTTTTSQTADASGLAVGLVAAGANVAQATSNVTTTALLSDMTSVDGGRVQLHATGTDTNVADAVSGSGGLVAGSAADAITSGTSTTRAAADTSAPANKYLISAINGTVDIEATHTANFGGQVDSTQASLVGASGATISHSVIATVDAHLGDWAYVRAANLTIAAHNLVHNYFIGETAANAATFNPDDGGWNVDSGSGGLVNAPAGKVAVNLTQNTTASIGHDADVHLLAPTAGVSALSLEAYNETVSHQKVKLDSGGAIALADTEGTVNSIANATTSIGDTGSVVADVGDLSLAAWGSADLGSRAAATTYGLAGAPSGRAYATYFGTNNVTLGQNVRLEASDGIEPTNGTPPSSGTIALSAGTGLDGTPETIKLATTVDLYNKTAIPISTTPDAQATVRSNGTVTVGSDDSALTPVSGGVYGVNAAGDITLRGSRGNIDATAVGTGKDIYREELAKAASAISNVFGGGDVTFDYHGGTVVKDGQGLVAINGLVDTGLQRHKTITFDYAPGCDTLVAACIASTAAYNIKYTPSGPEDVGTEILIRLNELNQLKQQYSSDPVALGAYNSEISFLQKKLVSLGLGSFVNGAFVPNSFAAPTPAQAQAFIDQDNSNISVVKSALGSAVASVAPTWTTDTASHIDGNYTDVTVGIDHYDTVIFGFLDGKFSGGDATTYSNYKTTIQDLVTAGKALVSDIGDLVTDNATQQTTINSAVTALNAAQTALATALLAGNTSDASTAQLTIATKKAAILTALGKIAANNATLTIKADAAEANGASIGTNVTNLLSFAHGALSGSNQTTVGGYQDDGGAGAEIIVRGGSIGNLAGNLHDYVGSIATVIAQLSLTPATPGVLGGINSVSQYADLLTSITGNLVAHTNAKNNPPTTPRAFTIDVADTAARLGNISIVADQLNGGGNAALKAPGDAVISITNNTANTLKLNNLLIPDYDAGNVRFNGALVGSNAAINALNPSGAGAAFATVETAATSSRPQVTITSNYNPESVLYYNPGSTDLRYKASHLPPDIILNAGTANSPKAINNLTGAVNIISAAGNIYINGTINAGSVNILAKNGDFVSSYVNGFDNIGGDPASFNDPTRSAEAGTGITANGAISIAARYLNVNSTIQSGIADWTLNLDGAPTLTTIDETAIGLMSGTVAGALQTYKDALSAATSAANTPSALIDLGVNSNGDHVYLNMAPAGLDLADLQSKIGAYKAAVIAGGTLPNPVVGVKLADDPTSTRTVNIKDLLSADTIGGRIEFDLATADAYASAHPSAAALYGVVSPSSNIGVSYDARNNQYEVDGTSVHGGYIQLYGQLMNTSKNAGQLNVLDGFGTINITNSSNIPVMLSTLKTGDDPTGTGRGTAGVIDIMDITGVDTSNAASPIVSATHTVYTRDYDPTIGGSGHVKKQVQTGRISASTGEFVDSSSGQLLDISAAAKVLTGDDRTASYATTADQRYVWTTGDYYEATTDFQTSGTQLFGSSDLKVTSFTSLTATSGPSQTAHVRLKDGTYMTLAGDKTQIGNDAIYKSGTEAGIIIVPADQSVSTIDNSDPSIADFYSSTHSFLTLNDLQPNGSSSDCNWWTLCIAQNYTYYYKLTQHYTTITTNSLKADNDIGVNFIGSDTGAINVNSSSNVVLTNAVTATNGAVTIKATGSGSIIEGNLAGQVQAKSADLEAAGSVGDVTWGKPTTGNGPAPTNAAIPVNLGGGSLIATAGDGNVLITSGTDLKVKQVTAAGDRTAGKGSVNLFTSKSITAADGSSYIQAPRVQLTALNGLVGSVADGQQLTVNTGFLYGDTTRAFGSTITDPTLGLSVIAGGDIGIKSSSWSGNIDGTMLIDQVLSLGGNVRLVSAGQILDNNPTETVDQRTYQQLVDYWDTLGLLAGSSENAAKQQAQITAYQNSKTQKYDQYWQIRHMQANGGTTYDSTFKYTLSAQQIAALTPGFEAQIRAANPAATDPEVATAVAGMLTNYADDQTKLYQQLNGEVGSLTTSFVNGYRYAASDAEKASLTNGAGWTERELAFSLSPGALKTVTATNPVLKDPNVSGRTVTLEAQKSVGETIGAGTGTPGVRIAANTNPADLTLDQKVALASAERSDLQLDVVYQGSTVHIPLGADYGALTPTQQAALDAAAAHTLPVGDITIVVLSKRPLNFSASTGVNVTVADAPSSTIDVGTAYLASRGDGLLGTFSVPGETRVKVIGNIGNAAGGGVISTGNLILEAAQGHIGVSGTPMQLAVNTGSTFTGRAQGGVNVDFTGSATIDTVYSPQDVRLDTTGSLLNANDDQLINVLGANVVLNATGTIGSGSRALNVGNALGGGITASAGGPINLFGPANNLFVVKSATSTTGNITLTAGFEGVIDGAVSAPGEIDLSAGGRLVISGVGSVHSTTGLVSVDADSLKMINGATITADLGRVLIDTAHDALVTGVTSGSADPYAVDIGAGGHVLAATDPNRLYDIKAMSAGAGVRIVAALGIGDETEADDKWADGPNDAPGSANAITSAGNALRILSSTVTLDAAAGDIYADLLAPKVKINLTAGSGNVHLDAAGELDIGSIKVKNELSLGVNVLTGTITQDPAGPNPLKLTLTGYHGGVGTSADINVEAPAGLIIPLLRFVDSHIDTSARAVSILSAYVPGSMLLTTPLQSIFLNDRSPGPVPGSNAQMYQPTYTFSLNLNNYHTTTNAFVVWYDTTAQVTSLLNGLPVDGASLVRDTARAMSQGGDPLQVLLVLTVGPDGEQVQHEFFFDENGHRVVIDGVAYPVGVIGSGPAVQISEAN